MRLSGFNEERGEAQYDQVKKKRPQRYRQITKPLVKEGLMKLRQKKSNGPY